MLKDGNPYPSKANHIDKNVRDELFTALYSIKVDRHYHPESYNPDGTRKTPWLDYPFTPERPTA